MHQLYQTGSRSQTQVKTVFTDKRDFAAIFIQEVSRVSASFPFQIKSTREFENALFVIDGKRLGQSIYQDEPIQLKDAVVRLNKVEHELACLQPKNLGLVNITFEESTLYILSQNIKKQKILTKKKTKENLIAQLKKKVKGKAESPAKKKGDNSTTL